MQPSRTRTTGFSLIEISVVITIIALLTGGVVVGQGMLRSSEVNSIGVATQLYISAVNTFKGQYKYLPGDLPTATSYWATDTDCTTANTTQTLRAATCNGNGNGMIDSYYSNNAIATFEPFRFWQHLANAGLIPGQFSGVAYTAITGNNTIPYTAGAPSTNVTNTQVGVNQPAMKMDNVGIIPIDAVLTNVNGQGLCSSTFGDVDRPTRNMFSIGRDNRYYNQQYFLTAVEAKRIDTKYDNGLPATGMIHGERYVNTGTPCATFAGGTTKIQSYYQVAATGNRTCYLSWFF